MTTQETDFACDIGAVRTRMPFPSECFSNTATASMV
jgi:hypothetical protein